MDNSKYGSEGENTPEKGPENQDVPKIDPAVSLAVLATSFQTYRPYIDTEVKNFFPKSGQFLAPTSFEYKYQPLPKKESQPSG